MRELRQKSSGEFVFPKRSDLRRFWFRLRQKVALTIGDNSPLRIHDQRHWFASAAS